MWRRRRLFRYVDPFFFFFSLFSLSLFPLDWWVWADVGCCSLCVPLELVNKDFSLDLLSIELNWIYKGIGTTTTTTTTVCV